MNQLEENDSFINEGGILKINEEFVTETVIKKEIKYCDCGCGEVANGSDEQGHNDCYIPGNHSHFPMHKKFVYEI